jgi:tetratricopeptide (TPR) repeat protein
MQKSCPSCGAETFPGARFCRRCGAAVFAQTGGDGTGDVSPQAATVPLVGEESRMTDGLITDSGQASANTSRVSLAEMERLLRAQQDALPQAPDPEATLVINSAATRPEAPAAVGPDEELTITVARPAQTRETTANSGAATDFEKTTDFEATHPADFETTRPAPPAQFGQATRDAPVFEGASIGNEGASIGTVAHAQPHGEGAAIAESREASSVAESREGASVTVGGARAPVARPRRKWPVVVAICAVTLVFTVAAAWLAFKLLRRPAVTDAPTQAPTAPAAADSKQQFEEKLAEAEALLAQGNMEGALARLREANTLDPENTRAHRRLGELLLSTGARREAIDELRAVTRNAPEDFTAWRQLATAQFAEGLYRDAAESYRRVLLLSAPGGQPDPNDMLSLADSLRLSGQADEARSAYQQLSTWAAPDIASIARQRLAELARAQPTPASTPRAGEQADEQQQPRAGETASAAAQPAQPAPAQPTPAPPQPTPTPPSARAAEVSPADHYNRGAGLWSSNRAAALEEFRAAAAGGNPDAHYYLGLSYVEGKNLHALKRAEIVAALQHFQLAQRGRQFVAESRRYEQQLDKEFDRLRKQ